MLGMFMVLPVLTTPGMALPGRQRSINPALRSAFTGWRRLSFKFLWAAVRRIGVKPLADCRRTGGIVAGDVAALSHSIGAALFWGQRYKGPALLPPPDAWRFPGLTSPASKTVPKHDGVYRRRFGISRAIAMKVLGPIVAHSLGLNALFWMIAALAATGIILTIWVPSSTNHVLNRESGMVKAASSKVLQRSRGCSSSVPA